MSPRSKALYRYFAQPAVRMIVEGGRAFANSV